MQETKDYLILQQLKDDIEEKFNTHSNTNIDDVKIGDYTWDDMTIKPSISISGYKTEVDSNHKVMGGSYKKKIYIYLSIYMDYDENINDWNEIYILKEQIENFLKSTSNTFQDGFQLGDQDVFYIFPSEKLAQAIINFTVIFSDVN